jgi:hypothetical protein
MIIDEVIMKMVNAIMWISPVGISSVICAKILGVVNLGSVMSQLGLFIVTVCSGIFIYQFTILQVLKINLSCSNFFISGNILCVCTEKPFQVLVGSFSSMDDSFCYSFNVSR